MKASVKNFLLEYGLLIFLVAIMFEVIGVACYIRSKDIINLWIWCVISIFVMTTQCVIDLFENK